MSYQIEGILYKDMGVKHISDKFWKREFIIQVEEYVNGTPRTQLVKVQLVKTKVAMLNKYTEGDRIKVTFYLRGKQRAREDGSEEYINSLEVININKINTI